MPEGDVTLTLDARVAALEATVAALAAELAQRKAKGKRAKPAPVSEPEAPKVALVKVKATAIAKRQPPEEKRVRWEGLVTEDSKVLVAATCKGELDVLAWNSIPSREQIMEALATVRAAAFHHERWSYVVRDCTSVASLLRHNRVSRIARGLYGASRDKWQRDELGTVEFHQLWNRLEVFLKNVERPHGRGRIDKGEAIRAWREAFALLPIGRQLDWDDEQDWTHKTAEQIALEAEDMRKIGTRR